MVKLVRVIHRPDYNHKPDECHYTYQVLGTPSYFEGHLKVPQVEKDLSSSLPLLLVR
jgi:hypothetical protein